MPLFRKVALPANARGQLFLHSMPGRYEDIDKCWSEVAAVPVHSIVCLAFDDEIAEKSPKYSSAIQSGIVPCERWPLSVKNYGIPEDTNEFFRVAERAAESLRDGRNVLVHCGAGIGRTGTFAAFVLMRLRVPLEEALKRVKAAGSGPETQEQGAFLEELRPNTDG